MKLRNLAILLIILLALVPIYYINQWLQKVIQPRRSFLQLLLYMIVSFILVFLYAFLLVMIIVKLFPVQKG